MGLRKGKTNNPKGRPKGTPNKTTAEIKAILTKFVGDNIEQLQADFDRLEPDKRLTFLRDILRFIVPVMSANNINAEVQTSTPIITFVSASELTPEQLEAFGAKQEDENDFI